MPRNCDILPRQRPSISIFLGPQLVLRFNSELITDNYAFSPIFRTPCVSPGCFRLRLCCLRCISYTTVSTADDAAMEPAQAEVPPEVPLSADSIAVDPVLADVL